jgi:glutamate 5-kinase
MSRKKKMRNAEFGIRNSAFRTPHSHLKRIVVKIGSSLLTRGGGHLDAARMGRLVRELAAFRRQQIEILIVSSGAIAAGMGELRWAKRPAELAKKQAAAAVGQPRLMETYRRLFRRHGLSVGQVLLTREDFENRLRLRNAQATLETLLQSGVVPIINENDTVAVEEIRLGDNDTLGALVAVNVKADVLILLTDVEGLYAKPPHQGPSAVIARVAKITARIEALAHPAPGSDRGTGGMWTKLQAGKRALKHGVAMAIISGKDPQNLRRLLAGRPTGTLFTTPRFPGF